MFFFWVIPQRLNFTCRRFGTLCLFHFHRRLSISSFTSVIPWLTPTRALSPSHTSPWPPYGSLPSTTCFFTRTCHSFLLAQTIFEPNLFPYKYSYIFKYNHPSYLSAYEDGTECSETSAYKI
jgi:hypothetical protein